MAWRALWGGLWRRVNHRLWGQG